MPAACSTYWAPVRRTVSMASADSMPAWASGRCASVTEPPARTGTPSQWPRRTVASMSAQYAGAPIMSAPLCMDESDEVPPYRNGVPGLASCVSTRPTSSSACCTARRPASVMGAVVPPMAQTATSTGWPRRARRSTTCAPSAENCSGDVVLTTDHRRGRACHSAPYRISSTSVATCSSSSEVTVNRRVLVARRRVEVGDHPGRGPPRARRSAPRCSPARRCWARGARGAPRS